MKSFRMTPLRKRDKITLLIVFTVIVLLIFLPSILSLISNVCDAHKVGNEMAEKILYALSNDDSDDIKTLLCEKTKRNYPVDQQINEITEFIEGKIISHGNISIGEGISSTSILKTDWQRIYVFIDDIKTDNGKSYYLKFNAYLIHHKIKNLIGISDMIIVERNSDKKEISRYEIGECYDSDGKVI